MTEIQHAVHRILWQNYSGERKKCHFYKKGYCESLNRRMFLIFTQYMDMELLFQNM